ncbi:transmembrane protein 33-like isoform X2 [Chiloscyllium plagiosum]|uniref:transmembrane protein 33-like isoform X2 n=1 Tax=Chiloscyllium plagiosum TaxID=36176 RepID=UPI001CB83136|nr:transmembrane protein 33-like isoform X2 [Chiloscyllium plagiosum]
MAYDGSNAEVSSGVAKASESTLCENFEMAEQGSTDKSTQSTDPSGCPDVDNGGTKTNRPVSVSKFMMSNKIESIMWLLRIFTLMSTFFFLFPILGVAEGGQFYQRALLANALTSACRLHQRLPRFRFSRAYVTQALLEDSCHYLLYSLIFITSHPITLCLVPVAVFSLLHATAYTRKILDIIGPRSVPWVRSFLDKMTTHQQSLFKFIAYNEILLMPAAVFMLFGGRAHLFLPFFYYRFLTLRYASRRNPYCRTLFYELRVAIEQMTARPSCPTFIRSACHKAIKLICKLAPGS